MTIIEKLGIFDIDAEKIWAVWALDWHHHDGEFDQVWLGYDDLSDKTGVEIKKLKKFIKMFRDKGFAYTSPTITCEGIPNGSGTFLKGMYAEKSWTEMKELIG